ncbi:hypothetical protein SAMN06297144_0443 [Sphingomonas guangdongensis]|uniref:Extracellular endo-alpha-(1->5)-L-arabinanase C-terminal domain-containing protein n=1 Tax=Sphingomonas guangdongensis TaxID=1141890 RepID=A0A285QBP4_9SPHN|nr:hypothetical protein [Sphingomonas guangdongensis]SOB79231.1 hypothetical protein SAMN06297144_0443 [Sphingomonas guangdongensis]
MKSFVTAAMLMLAASAAQAQTGAGLAGEWTVDLAVDPAKPYTRPMKLALGADGTVTGSFYDSAIENGRWRTDPGRTCVSFRTSDGKGPYHTAACLRGEVVEGQTWAEHRSFLFNWHATRFGSAAGATR